MRLPFGLKLFLCLLRCSSLTDPQGMQRSSRLEYGAKEHQPLKSYL
ncbi:hypothetical protein KAI78_10305 [bacterium]|nr:hypothetical protein [bacterium]